MELKHGGYCKYSSTYLNLGTTWIRVVSFTLRPLYPRQKEPSGNCVVSTSYLDTLKERKYFSSAGNRTRTQCYKGKCLKNVLSGKVCICKI